MFISGQKVVVGDGTLLEPGWIEISGGNIVQVQEGPCPQETEAQYPVICPGFIDIHNHGKAS